MTTDVTPEIDRLVDAVVGAAPTLDAGQQRLAVALYRMLAEGRPVAPAQLARRTGQPEQGVRATLDAWPGVFYEEGNVVGFWGLALPEMPFAFDVDGTRLHTWCAWDPLFIAPILGRQARVATACPVTGRQVTMVVGPKDVRDVSPSAAVMSFLVPRQRWDDDVITTFCHFVLFFASPDAAQEWVAEHPGTVVLSIADGYELGRRWNRARLGVALSDAYTPARSDSASQ